MGYFDCLFWVKFLFCVVEGWGIGNDGLLGLYGMGVEFFYGIKRGKLCRVDISYCYCGFLYWVIGGRMM